MLLPYTLSSLRFVHEHISLWGAFTNPLSLRPFWKGHAPQSVSTAHNNCCVHCSICTYTPQGTSVLLFSSMVRRTKCPSLNHPGSKSTFDVVRSKELCPKPLLTNSKQGYVQRALTLFSDVDVNNSILMTEWKTHLVIVCLERALKAGSNSQREGQTYCTWKISLSLKRTFKERESNLSPTTFSARESLIHTVLV